MECKSSAAAELKWKQGTVLCPVKGCAVTASEIPNEIFAAGTLGCGVGIEPARGVVTAPCDGQIGYVAPTGHAVGITTRDDMEVLVHVGLDTLEMKGEGFEVLVEPGEMVKAGQKLMNFSIPRIRLAGHPAIVVVMLTNAADYFDVEIRKTGEVEPGDLLMTVGEQKL